MSKRKVVLIQPPMAMPLAPGLSTPSLKAFLVANGVDVIQRDLNIEFYHHILSVEMVKAAAGEVEKRLRQLSKPGEALAGQDPDRDRFLRLAEKFIPYVDRILAKLDDAKRSLMPQADGRPVQDVHDAVQMLERAVAIVGLAHYPTRLSLVNPPLFRMRYHFSDSREISAALENERENLFISYYKDHVLPDLYALEPLWVGISIMHPFQVIPGFTLARSLKEKGVFTCVGGEMFTKELEIHPDLFEYADCFVEREGESASLAISRILERGGADFSDVPNIVLLDNNDEIYRAPASHEDLDALPCPDFSDFDLSSSFPGLMGMPSMLPLSNEKGCYWNKCAFCDIPWSHSVEANAPRLRERSVRKIVDDVRKLVEQTGVRMYYLTGESPTPASLLSLAGKFLEERIKVNWMAYARFEKQFTPEACRLLRKGGLFLVQLGLESACQRILDLMDKGTEVDTIRTVLENFRDAGIRYNVFLMVGAPTETAEEAQETFDFILSNPEIFDSPLCNFQIGTVVFPRRSIMFQHPESFGITDIHYTGRNLKARHDYSFESAGGLSRKEAAELIRQFRKKVETTFTWGGGQWKMRKKRPGK